FLLSLFFLFTVPPLSAIYTLSLHDALPISSDFFNFSSTKMNEFRLAFNRSNVRTGNKSLTQNWNDTFGIPNGNLGDAGTQGLAEFTMQGVPSIAQPDWVGYIVSNTIAATDNFTWVKGRHFIKVGTNINHVVDVSADT